MELFIVLFALLALGIFFLVRSRLLPATTGRSGGISSRTVVAASIAAIVVSVLGLLWFGVRLV